MKHYHYLAMLTAGFLTTACSTTTTAPHRVSYSPTPTPYLPSSQRFGKGYTTIRVAENLYLISFIGNDATSLQMVMDSARYRAAEVTLKTGYRYFAIIDSYTLSSAEPGYLPSGNWVSHPWYTLMDRRTSGKLSASQALRRDSKRGFMFEQTQP